MAKKIIWGGLYVVLLYLTLEFVCYVGLRAIYSTNPYLFTIRIDQHFSRVDDAEFAKFKQQAYDPLIGWDHKANNRVERKNCLGDPWAMTHNSDGSRTDPVKHTSLNAVAYGDSFTEGAEVNDNQTWPHHLASLLGAGVANRGVGGQGTYQALLKWKRDISNGLIYPVTILGIHESNIARTMNAYRPFLYLTAEYFTFKPSIRCDSKKCRTYDNPLLETARTIRSAIAAARSVEHIDPYALRKPRRGFPYILNTVKALREIYAKSQVLGERLWTEHEGQAVMEHIVTDFYESAKAVGTRPVILFIPGPQAISTNATPPYSQFIEKLSGQFDDLILVDIAEAVFDHSRFNLQPFKCHASSYGNQVIANAIHTKLRGHE